MRSPTVGALWGVWADEVGMVSLVASRACLWKVGIGAVTVQVPMLKTSIALDKPEQCCGVR